MARYITILAVWVGGLASLAALAQVTIPSAWQKLSAVPAPDSDERTCAGLSPVEWDVRFEGARLLATPTPPMVRRDALPYDIEWRGVLPAPPAAPGSNLTQADRESWAMSHARDHARRIVVPTADGWLVGFDSGESGGSLWWYPAVPGPGLRLSGRNVRAIVETADRSYLVLLAWGFDWTVPGPNPRQYSGSAVTVTNQGGAAGWHVVNQVELQGNPTEVLADASGYLIATTRSVEHLSHEGTVQVLSTADVMPNGFVTLAVGPGGTIAVGRRFFVQLLTPSGDGFHDQWLIPSECTRVRWEGVLCECVGPS